MVFGLPSVIVFLSNRRHKRLRTNASEEWTENFDGKSTERNEEFVVDDDEVSLPSLLLFQSEHQISSTFSSVSEHRLHHVDGDSLLFVPDLLARAAADRRLERAPLRLAEDT